jgi:hypothetical protein
MPFPDKSTCTLVLMKTLWQYVTVNVKYVTGMSYALPYVHFGSQQLAAEALMVAQF